MKLWHTIAYLNLLVLAIDHLDTGVAAVFFATRSAGLYRRLFGARFPVDSPLGAVLRPWGALGVYAGLTGLLPLYDLARYHLILYALLFLISLRVFIRLSYDSAALQSFGLSPKRNYVHAYLVLQCATILGLQLVWW